MSMHVKILLNVSDAQRHFMIELQSLKSDHYVERFAHYGQTFWMVKLQHLTNGRRLMLKWHCDYMELFEGGKLLKQYPDKPEHC